jgi:Tfp pilus assembly protein PilE
MDVKRKNASASGFTLPGITAVALLIGIFAICCIVFFGNAARVRMDARQRQAALIQANSLMERAYEAADASVYANMGAKAWFAVEADGSLSYSGVNPLETWTVDGKSLPLSITIEKVGGWDRFVDITVAVHFDSGTAETVTLNAYRYCNN